MAGQANLMNSKITCVFKFMDKLSILPKDFVIGFLKDNSTDFAIHQQYWAAKDRGWKSTVDVVHAIRDVVNKKEVGKKLWMDLILSKASIIVSCQKPPVHLKHFYSTSNISQTLLTDETAKELREKSFKTTASPIQSNKKTTKEPAQEDNSDSEKDEDNSNDKMFDGNLKKLKSLEGRKAA
ncbi:hypothetical protein PCASD_08989 [Puccinia coronata f. sp. avenae]|uniref:Uncharacterized protein n=1 Tax=Puccinia coronata f. sp. avenae TaxID=200324 RepID=A0A2N5UKV7_9BASI|nr:hypothetical protein PCASD_08989 [Puccinia coronata f. sp. avenae]